MIQPIPFAFPTGPIHRAHPQAFGQFSGVPAAERVTLCGESLVDRSHFFDVQNRAVCPKCEAAMVGLRIEDELTKSLVTRSLRAGAGVGVLVGLILGVIAGWGIALVW